MNTSGGAGTATEAPAVGFVDGRDRHRPASSSRRLLEVETTGHTLVAKTMLVHLTESSRTENQELSESVRKKTGDRYVNDAY